MNQRNLELCRNMDVKTCDPDMLVDLQDLHIDASRPRSERMEAFVQQVGNPYLFKVDGLVIKAVYAPGNGRSLTDALPHC